MNNILKAALANMPEIAPERKDQILQAADLDQEALKSQWRQLMYDMGVAINQGLTLAKFNPNGRGM